MRARAQDSGLLSSSVRIEFEEQTYTLKPASALSERWQLVDEGDRVLLSVEPLGCLSQEVRLRAEPGIDLDLVLFAYYLAYMRREEIAAVAAVALVSGRTSTTSTQDKEESTMNETTHTLTRGPNWRQVGLFLGLTFALTYLLDLILYLTVGYSQQVGTLLMLQLQMLLPAAVAIALQLFVFRDSPIYRTQERTRWFFYFYLTFTALFVLFSVVGVTIENAALQSILSLLPTVLSVLGLGVVVVLRLVAGKDEFQRAGLKGGKLVHYLLFGVAIVLVYYVMTFLNSLFELGQTADVNALMVQAGVPEGTIPPGLFLLAVGFQNILLAPILGLLIAFGEEYGWRGYLQGELIRMGKVKGIALVGVIWGLWHAPIIMMGHNFPGYPGWGVVAMTLYCIGLAFFLGYAVLKTGSVWLAAFLHALNNSVASFLMVLVYMPNDPMFSFGVGIYSLAVWALVIGALFVLDRKAWFGAAE